MGSVDRAFRTHYQDVLRVLVRQVGDPHEAEDLAQDVFVKLLDYDLGEVRQLWPFLRTIARNLARDRYRYFMARNLAGHVPIDDVSVVADEPAIDEALIAGETVRSVLAGLARLKPKCRTAILLHRVEGRTYEEIAGLLGMSYGGTRKLIGRGIDSFRMD